MKKLTKKESKAIEALITESERELLLNAMWRLWEYIGSDAELACAEAGQRLDNESAAEFVLDAQRLESDAVVAQDAPLLAALKKFRELDWELEIKFLLSHHTFA